MPAPLCYLCSTSGREGGRVSLGDRESKKEEREGGREREEEREREGGREGGRE